MSRFRSTTLDYVDEPQRWDRDKFERFSRGPPPPPRGPPGYDREELEINIERDRFPPRGPPPRVAERPPPRTRYEERERFYDEDRLPPSRRRPEFLDEPIPAEIANRALAPYRRRPVVEREPSPPMRRPSRPAFLRRQSSLDTFDRRAMPRYGDEYRIPAEVPIPLPIRRQRSPPRRRYPEEEIEETRYKEGPGYEEYRDIRVRRERRAGGRSRSRAATSIRSASSGSSSFEEIAVEPPEAPKAPEPPKIGKKGKTRMPKRLAHKKAVAELGIPFEEEDDFLIIQRALAKENIDEIIEKSKTYKEEKTIYKYEGGKEVTEEKKEEEKKEEEKKKEEAPPPPPPAPASAAPAPAPPPPAPASAAPAPPPPAPATEAPPAAPAPPPPPAPPSHHPGETVIKTTTTILEGNPPPPPPAAPSVAASHRTHKSHLHEHEIIEERHYSDEVGGPLMLVDRGRQSDYEIRREIKALEAERRALKLEREADERRYQAALIRDGDYEVIERVDTYERPRERTRARSVVRVEKDRKGRLALVKSTH